MNHSASGFDHGDPIARPSRAAAQAARRRLDALTKPRGSLGRLEMILEQLAAAQDDPSPASRPAAAVLFAADHGVHEAGVSAYPQAVTAAMVGNFVAGGAAASVACRHLRMPLHVVDVGVAESPDGVPDRHPAPEVSLRRTGLAGRVSPDIREHDAMTPERFTAAVAAGIDAVDALEPDTRVVALGEMGIANTTVASAVAACLLHGRAPIDELVGHGTGIDEPTRQAKVRAVGRVLTRVGPNAPAAEVLRRAGGHELAALAGAMLRCAQTRRVALVDGFIVTAAALALCRARPEVRPYLLFAHRGAEPGHRRLLEALDAAPLLDLALRLGEGSGALLALPLLDQAVALHRGMATFADAAVPDRAATPDPPT